MQTGDVHAYQIVSDLCLDTIIGELHEQNCKWCLVKVENATEHMQ